MSEQPYEVAIVLGAALRPDGRPSRALLRRVGHAAGLYLTGRVERLLMSGGVVGPPPSEAAVMRRVAIAAGVPPEAVLTEERSRTTLENARFTRDIVHAAGWTRVLLVTDAYHLPRSLYAFRRFGLGVDGEAAAPAPAMGELIRACLREALAMPVYLWRVERAAGPTRPARPRKAG